jgi:hypothetical protein
VIGGAEEEVRDQPLSDWVEKGALSGFWIGATAVDGARPVEEPGAVRAATEVPPPKGRVRGSGCLEAGAARELQL